MALLSPPHGLSSVLPFSRGWGSTPASICKQIQGVFMQDGFGVGAVWGHFHLEPPAVHRTWIKAANGFLSQCQGQRLWIWFSSQRQLGTKEE